MPAIRIEPSHKRVRTYLAGQLVADTLHPVLVWEGPNYPVYYLPAADIRRITWQNAAELYRHRVPEAVAADPYAY